MHHPIEPHGAIAHWDTSGGGKPMLTVYDTTQSLAPSRATYAKMFGLSPDRVRVICPYIGGAFGSKGTIWTHAPLAILCSQLVGAPVSLTLTRRQLYGGTGHRTPIRQRVAIGADGDGRIRSLIHAGVSSTSVQDTYNEAFTMATRMMYRADALRLDQRMCRLNTQSPTFMRAPAETPGMFALETAIDELAVRLDIDPIELRIKNEPSEDLHSGLPFSSRLLVDCLRRGSKQFGWENRNSTPGKVRDGRWLVGHGVAAATYPVFGFPTSARVTIHADGTAAIGCCSHEMGTGTRTVQSQLLAGMLGIPAGRVSMTLGDTELPPGGISGGSATTGSLGGAVRDAVNQLRTELLKLAQKDGRMKGVADAEVRFAGGNLVAGDQSIALEDLIAGANRDSVSAIGKFSQVQNKKYSAHSFGAQFVEIGVDESLGLVRVRRMLGCFACGTILNARTARSQFIGGMIMGVGHALQEAIHWDHRIGRITNDNLAEYHVPVNADIPDIEVSWIDTPDFNASAIGAKGIGEIGITGVAAAIGNAIFNATGRRIRDLPITPEAVMA